MQRIATAGEKTQEATFHEVLELEGFKQQKWPPRSFKGIGNSFWA